jgi:hypothetical protein
VKTYIVTRTRAGVQCQANDNAAGPKHNGNVTGMLAGKFSIGDASKETQVLAAAIMAHYYDAKPSDPGATAQAQRQTKAFMDAYLLHHRLPLNGRLVISSDVIDRFFSLLAQIPSVR